MLVQQGALLRLCVGEVIYRLLEAHITSVFGYLKALLLLLRDSASRLHSRLCTLELLLGFCEGLLCFQLSPLRRLLGGRLVSYGLRLRSLDNRPCLLHVAENFPHRRAPSKAPAQMYKFERCVRR